MALSKEHKAEIIKKFGNHGTDTSSASVQVALLTERLNYLNEHLKINKKDFHTRQGLLKMVGKRRKLLTYLFKSNPIKYKTVLQELNIRK